MSAPVLRLRALRKRLPDGRRLLEVEEIALHAGHCLLLSGANGAGKTTLLRILAALEPPDSAEVEFDGWRRPWARAAPAYRRHVIYLHQQPYLFRCNVADNVGYGLRRSGLARAEIARRVAQALEWSELAHLAARNAEELSGGERQRVALTRAWVLAPKVLLLDEPLANLDEAARSRSYFLIQRLKSEGVALLVTCHEPHTATALADAQLRLEDGRLRRATARRPVANGAGALRADADPASLSARSSVIAER